MRSARRWICSVLLAGGCAYSDPGVVVEVTASAPAAENVATFTTDHGDTVTVARAYVVVRTVEIMPCETAMWRRALHDLVSFEGTAYGHEKRVLDVLGESVALDLLAPAATRSIGAMPARASAHCGVEVAVGPADDETHDLPDGVDVAGVSLYLEGRATVRGQEKPFVITATGGAIRRVQVEAFAPARDSPRPGLMIQPELAHWLDGVDLEAPDGAKVLANAAAALRIEVVED